MTELVLGALLKICVSDSDQAPGQSINSSCFPWLFQVSELSSLMFFSFHISASREHLFKCTSSTLKVNGMCQGEYREQCQPLYWPFTKAK